MYMDEITNLFESALKKTKIKNHGPYKERLRIELNKKKYDTQDKSLMEILLKEDSDEFRDGYIQLLNESVLNRKDIENYLDTEECIEETVNLYLQSLEHSIDYYYNSIIAKHFSSN